MIFRIKYSKSGRLRWLSHMDVYRTWSRVINRAGLPVEYTQGFSPHQRISMGPALPVGVGSGAEYLDITMEGADTTEGGLIKKINSVAPPEMRVHEARKIAKRDQSLGTAIVCADYCIRIASCRKNPQLPELEDKIRDKVDGTTLDNEAHVYFRFWPIANMKEKSNGLGFLMRLPVGIRINEVLDLILESIGAERGSIKVDREAQWIVKNGSLAEPMGI